MLTISSFFEIVPIELFDKHGLSHGNRGAIHKLCHRGKFRPKKGMDWRTPYEVNFDKVLHLI